MPTPKEEAESLMNDLLPLAKRMLSEDAEFYPYGGFLRPTGEIVHVGATVKGAEHPKSKDVMKLLVQSLKERARSGAATATAIIFHVRIVPPGKKEKAETVQVSIDHVDGFSAEVFFPYVIENGREVVFGRTFAQKGDGAMFS
jgi:hypothetical protein